MARYTTDSWEDEAFPGLDTIYRSSSVEEIDVPKVLSQQEKYIRKFLDKDGAYVKYLFQAKVLGDMNSTNFQKSLRLIGDCARELLELVLDEMLEGVVDTTIIFTITGACISIAMKLMGGIDWLPAHGRDIHRGLDHFSGKIAGDIDRYRLSLMETDILSRTDWRGCKKVADIDKLHDSQFAKKYAEPTEHEDLRLAETYSAHLKREAKAVREEARIAREAARIAQEEARIAQEEARIAREEARIARDKVKRLEQEAYRLEYLEIQRKANEKNAKDPNIEIEERRQRVAASEEFFRKGREMAQRTEDFEERYGLTEKTPLFDVIETDTGYMLRTPRGEYIEPRMLAENGMGNVAFFVDEDIQKRHNITTKKDLGALLLKLKYPNITNIYLSRDSRPVVVSIDDRF